MTPATESAPITLAQALTQLVARQDLSRDEMLGIMRQVMSGAVPAEQLAGLLMALRVKRESVDEIAAAAQVMREFATPVPINLEDIPNLVDLCGTGATVPTALTFPPPPCLWWLPLVPRWPSTGAEP